MENLRIKNWLGSKIGSDYRNGFDYRDGSGNGDGYGYGDGSGNGFGSGYGNGFGSGDGYGDGYDYGNGFGSGYGNDFGSGNGSGFGSGYGYGDGDGYGSGYGYGDGYGSGKGNTFGDTSNFKFKKYQNDTVYYIDDTPTVIKSILYNYAKGYTINSSDFNETECYIAKSEDGRFFAHGKTLHKAFESLREKMKASADLQERISSFIEKFKPNKKYKCSEFYRWHQILTGSCEFGRNRWLEEHNITLEDEFTVEEFIEKTENDYGADIIQKLKSEWEKANDKG